MTARSTPNGDVKMQITFDPRDPNACASVLAIISALHGDANLVQNPAPTFESPDPSQAFDAPSPEAAFAATATNPIAAPGTLATSAPAIGSETGPVATSTASPSSGVELDAHGLPWDVRIHSGPPEKKPKNADGTWRAKRNVDATVVAQVQAELRAVMAAPGAAPVAAPLEPAPVSPPAPVAAAPIPAPPAPAPIPVAAPTVSGEAVAAPVANAVPAPVAVAAQPTPAAPPSAAPVQVTTFAELMKKVTRMQTAGAVSVELTSQIAQSLGLTGVRDMINRPDLVPAFDALLPVEAA